MLWSIGLLASTEVPTDGRLSVRRKTNPQAIADIVSGDTSLLFDPHRSIVVLIHGYNVDEDEAQEDYDRFYGKVAAIMPNKRLPPGVSVLGFHWPGDVTRKFLRPLRSSVSFGHRLAAATLSGERLAACLQHARAREIFVVAHSLGTRVALTALRQSQSAEGTEPTKLRTLRRAILMAGAVTEAACRTSSDFTRPTGDQPEFSANLLAAGDYWNLHSTEDGVLWGPFRLAMFVEGEASLAIGHKGGPRGRWGSNVINTHRLHGEYWDYAHAHRLLAEAISPTMVRAGKPSRELPKRKLPDWNLHR